MENQFRLAYASIRGSTKAQAIDRMWMGTQVSFDTEEAAFQAATQFVELARDAIITEPGIVMACSVSSTWNVVRWRRTSL